MERRILGGGVHVEANISRNARGHNSFRKSAHLRRTCNELSNNKS